METILSDDVRKMIGKLSVDNFSTSPYFYAKTDYKIENKEPTDEDFEMVKNNSVLYFSIFESFISFLWLIKDNCCSVNSFYTHFVDDKKIMVNTTSNLCFSAEGKGDQVVTFSTHEMNLAIELFVKGTSTFYHKNIKAGNNQELINKIQLNPYNHSKVTSVMSIV